MSNFVPPYPPRMAEPPSSFRRLQLARRNFLAMWEEVAFELDFSNTRVFMRETFLCNSPDSVQFAFSTHNPSFERKAPQMRHALEPLLGDGLFVSDGATWRKRRRMIAPIVHVSRLSQFAPVMVEAAEEVRDRWAKSEGQMVDMLMESATLTAEVICRSLFGRKLGHDYARQIVESFSEYQSKIGQIDLISLLGFPEWFPRWHGFGIRKSVKRIHDVLKQVIDDYRSQKKDEGSVIEQLLNARDPETGEPLDPEAMRNEIAVLFMAGHETTANSLTWTWYLLSQARDVRLKLQHELDTVLGGRSPTLADVPKLVYTRAVFEEALRLYPPVPILPRQAVRDESYNGVRIPKGSLIFVVPWLLHRHKKLWDQPDHFIPERFLPENAAKISKFAYIPFSIGPRICAGMSFGLTEAILCLATLAQKFELRLKPGHDVHPVCRLTLRPEGGLPMTVHARAPRAGVTATAAPQAVTGCPVHHG
ncbi:MAG TPA: cytochrome P450 [Pseudolabrys sp.]|nr:cytochrome P450 [Pseudolabrys sp.]